MPLLINKNIVPFSDIRHIQASALNQAFSEDIVTFLKEWNNQDKPTITIKTSGSTGIPKSIELPKKVMIASALKTQKYFGYRSGQMALLCLPVNFIAGKMMLVRSIVSDLILLVQDPQSNPIQNVQEEIDFVAMTPHQLNVSLVESKSKLDYFKTILLGGAPVSKKLELEIQKMKSNCYLSYGMTETASHVAIRKMNTDQATSYFTSIEGVNFKTNNNGCLIIKGDHLDNTIYTNDIVDLIDAHRFYYKGRIDNVINSGSIKVSPESLEAQLSEIIDHNFIISSIDDDTLGDRLVLIIETNNQEQSIDESEIKKKIRDIMKNSIKPEIIFTVPKFIYSTTGKVLRSETTKLALQTHL